MNTLALPNLPAHLTSCRWHFHRPSVGPTPCVAGCVSPVPQTCLGTRRRKYWLHPDTRCLYVGAWMLLVQTRAERAPAPPPAQATWLERGLYPWACVSSRPAAQMPLPQVWLFALLLFSLKSRGDTSAWVTATFPVLLNG